MKTIIILSVLILLFNCTRAQSGSNDILKKIPAVPTNVCTATNETQMQFKEKIWAVIREVDTQIMALKKQSQPDEAQAKSQAEQMLKQQGLSQADMDKMKSKKMTKEEKQALAEKMMQQSTNMSMAEISSLKNMSKEAKQAYAEGYTTEAVASAQTNTKNNKIQGVNTKNNADVISQRNELYQKITARQLEVKLNYQKIEQDPGGLKLMDKMNSLRVRMGDLIGSGGEEVWKEKDKKEYDAAKAQFNQLQKEYCQYMSPLYFKALGDHFAQLPSSYSDYQKLDEMTEIIDNTIVTIGTRGKAGNIEYLDGVKSYLQYLKDVYKYKPSEE